MIGSAMGAAIAGALLGPVLGAPPTALGPEVVFCAVAVVGVGAAVWALRTPAAEPDGTAPLRDLLAAARQRTGASLGMWLTTLPGLLFGTLGVLGAAAARRARRRRRRDRAPCCSSPRRWRRS